MKNIIFFPTQLDDRICIAKSDNITDNVTHLIPALPFRDPIDCRSSKCNNSNIFVMCFDRIKIYFDHIFLTLQLLHFCYARFPFRDFTMNDCPQNTRRTL